MADVCDQADLAQEENLRHALLNAQAQVVQLKPKGLCYFCREPLELKEALYCDQYCAEDDAKLQRQQGFQR